jgi:cupin 2 domain-containing protein
MVTAGNLFADVPANAADETVTALLQLPQVRIERIVSHGHASPPDFWYDQAEPEWVLVLAGSAAVLFEDEPQPRALKRGDYLHIPAHVRHRVVWTEVDGPTIWLAVHCQ